MTGETYSMGDVKCLLSTSGFFLLLMKLNSEMCTSNTLSLGMARFLNHSHYPFNSTSRYLDNTCIEVDTTLYQCCVPAV